MENNIDKDIEIVKEKIKALNLHILNYKKAECETSFYQTLVKERDALVNVLSELETYKKIARKLAEACLFETSYTSNISKERVINMIEQTRNEVEK